MTDIERIKLMQKIHRIARVHPVATLATRLEAIRGLLDGKDEEARPKRGSRRSKNRLESSAPDRAE